jgi:HK97 gp10 family phage protein
VSINFAVLKQQFIEAAVVAVNATAQNAMFIAKEKAPVRKVFAGGRQTVRFKTAAEIEQGRELRSRLGLGPEILATAGTVGRVQARGLNPKRATRIGGEEFGFARTIEAPGRTRKGSPTSYSYLRKQDGLKGGEVVTRPRVSSSPSRTHTGRPRNLSNRANAWRASASLRLLDPLDKDRPFARLLSDEAESRLTARGRYELASKRAISVQIRTDLETGRVTSDFPRLGGALRESIRVEKATAAMFPIIKASVVAGGGDVDYAKYQELGTRHNPEHPFLRPALAEVRGQLPDALLRSLRRLGR